MNIARDNDIFIIIASLIIFFFVIGAGIMFFVLLYYKRRRTYLKENELLKANYEKSLLQSRLEVQEQSFDFISQELHDNIGQLLSLAKVQLNIIDQKKTYDPLAMTEVKENISKAISDLRDMARGLNTGNIHLSALTDLVTVEISRINRTGLLTATLELKGDEPKIKNDHKLILLRIIQESLQNIIKHASATSIVIDVNYNAEEIFINISDDGKGFDFLTAKDKNDSLGLKNIMSRAAMIGGKAVINSIPEKGTTVTITVPYD